MNRPFDETSHFQFACCWTALASKITFPERSDDAKSIEVAACNHAVCV